MPISVGTNTELIRSGAMRSDVVAERFVRLDARIAAVEHLIACLWAQVFLSKAEPPKDAKAINEGLREMLGNQLAPQLTQSWIDSLSLAFECAMERDLLLMEALVEQAAKQHSPTQVGRRVLSRGEPESPSTLIGAFSEGRIASAERGVGSSQPLDNRPAPVHIGACPPSLRSSPPA